MCSTDQGEPKLGGKKWDRDPIWFISLAWFSVMNPSKLAMNPCKLADNKSPRN